MIVVSRSDPLRPCRAAANKYQSNLQGHSNVGVVLQSSSNPYFRHWVSVLFTSVDESACQITHGPVTLRHRIVARGLITRLSYLEDAGNFIATCSIS